MFNQVTFIGLGLIGSSLARVIRAQGLAKKIVASCSYNTQQQALSLNLIDTGFDRTDLEVEKAVEDADLIVLAMPVGATEDVLRIIKRSLKKRNDRNIIITDVGSTKGNVVEAARSVFGRVPNCFVPAHPIAGSEKHGVLAGDANLFKHKKLIITPLEYTDAQAIQKIKKLWLLAGADVEQMSVEQHDFIFAKTSHLPHFLAFAMIDALKSKSLDIDVFDYAAGGLRDFTRIAESEPMMWKDIFIANKKNLLMALEYFSESVEKLKTAIEQESDTDILKTLTDARDARKHFSDLLEKRAK